MAMAMKMVAMEVAKQVIQIVGEKLGLPQGIIDMCKMACASAAGMPDSARTSFGQAASGLASQLNLSPSDSGRFQREMQDSVNNSTGNMRTEIDKVISDVQKVIDKKSAVGGDEETGESWLVALAKALGSALDSKAAQMKKQGDLVTAYSNVSTTKDKNGSLSAASQDNQNKLSSASTLLQAYSQEMSMISNAATNIIKTFGEANATLARK